MISWDSDCKNCLILHYLIEDQKIQARSDPSILFKFTFVCYLTKFFLFPGSEESPWTVPPFNQVDDSVTESESETIKSIRSGWLRWNNPNIFRVSYLWNVTWMYILKKGDAYMADVFGRVGPTKFFGWFLGKVSTVKRLPRSKSKKLCVFRTTLILL